MQAGSREGFLLWVLTNRPFVSARQHGPRLSALPTHLLQNIVSKHSSQFRGNAQHDALEFLLWLLDRMHEDLGAASPAQQSRVPEEVGGPRRGGRTPWLGWGCPRCVWDRGSRDGRLELSPPRQYGMGMRVMWFGRYVGGKAGGVWVLGSWAGWLGCWECVRVLAGARSAEHPSSGGHPGSWGCWSGGDPAPPRPSPPPAKPAVITALGGFAAGKRSN